MVDSSDAFVLERVLFSENGVWFYQVPAGQVTSLAPRADAWDPENPLLTGSVRVLQRGDACCVQLLEPVAASDESATATLFAQCPLHITRDLTLDVYVHDCVDSSRYFMLRVEDEQSGRRAFVGIGFPDRTAAFNFKATVQDYAKYALRQLDVQQDAAKEHTAVGEESPKKSNLSLPEGATIRINLKTNGVDEGERRQRSSSGGAVSPNKVPLIPPPPGDSPTAKVPAIAPPPAVAESTTACDDEDWGDFTSA